MKLISAREPRAVADEHGEARRGDLDAAFEIEDAELGAKVPVGLRLEFEHPRLAVAAHLAVVGRTLADRHRGMGQVRQRQQRDFALVFD
jgi:hypothetical protein